MKLKAGDKAKVVGNSVAHGFEIGEIASVTSYSRR